MHDLPDPSRDDDLRDLPILREIGVDVRAMAAEASHREHLRHARATRRRRLMVRVGVPAIAVAAVAAIAVPVLDIGGRSGLSPVEAAAAALRVADGDVLHVVLSGGAVQPDGSPQETRLQRGGSGTFLGRRSEQWYATSPLRFRISTDVVDRDGQRVGTLQGGRDESGQSWESAETGRVRRSGHARVEASLLATIGSDPVSGLGRLLESGQLREDGTVTLDSGRTARVFVAETAGAPNGQGGWTADQKTVYYADAETSRPLRVETFFRPPMNFGADVPVETRERVRRHAAGYQLTSRVDVDTFTRLDPAPNGVFSAPGNE